MGSPDTITASREHPLILFDGVCNLCNGAVQFIIRRDRDARFRFASLQSEAAAKFVHPSESNLSTILLVRDGMVYDRSSALMEIARDLPSLRWAFHILRFIPRPVRDFFYRLIAASRYRLFGKKDECMIPTPELRSRFL